MTARTRNVLLCLAGVAAAFVAFDLMTGAEWASFVLQLAVSLA